ncbi:hypothetical protein [Treponema zioleckii]|uniref:hypothetical protein n=1 Tax=Treponema zioleckii TaxID=331680 RepID=UPI00168B3A16|nr:hypothetical protein [Treponema zioleckii]
MVNGHSGKTSWYAKGFPPASLSVHFSKHGKALGCKSKLDYNNKVVDFMNAEETESTDTFTKNGTVYKFDYDTHEFGMAKSDGTMITYFIPDEPADEYWEGVKEENDNDF